jgi:DnaA-homolog protein
MQAILSLEIPYQPLLADVRIGSNAAALHAIQQWTAAVLAVSAGQLESYDANAERCMLCWGGSGVGKSAVALALENTTGAVRLNETSTPRLFEVALQDAHIRAVVIDNIDQLDATQARAAFNLYNHVRATPGVYFWASSRLPPSHMTGLLPDLVSRLSWGLVFELLPLTDADSIAVLQAQARRLGFELSSDAAHYLLVHLERNLTVLVEQLGNLNHHALKLKKPVNSHLVQQWYATVYVPMLALQRTREESLNNTVSLHGTLDTATPVLPCLFDSLSS